MKYLFGNQLLSAKRLLSILLFFSFYSAFCQSEKPKKLLHLSFNDEKWVEYSAVGSKVDSLPIPVLVKGHKGNAASIFERQHVGILPLKGNLNKEKGTLTVWYKPDFPDGIKGVYPILWQGKDPAVGANSIWVWIWDGNCRFDVRDKGDNYCTVDASGWMPDAWKHLAFTWDSSKGTAIWIDGVKACEKMFKWDVINVDELIIGANADFTEFAAGVLDELEIFDRPLTADEIMSDYQGTLKSLETPPVLTVTQAEPAKKEMLFHLSFDKGFNADSAHGDCSPVEIKNATLVDALTGKGALVPKDAYLLYKAGPNFQKAAGTLSMWIKLNWTPDGNGYFADGSTWHGIFMEDCQDDNKNLNLRMMLSSYLYFTWRGAPHSTPYSVSVQKQIFKDEWHHYVFTWDKDKRVATYIDGSPIFFSDKLQRDIIDHAQFFIGSCGEPSNARPGIDGIIDEVSIYNWAFSDEEVKNTYAQVLPICPTVYDYAGLSGVDNKLRLKWVNISKQDQQGEFEIAVADTAGTVIASSKQKISLSAGQTTIEPTVVHFPAPGIYSLLIRKNGVLLKQSEIFAVSAESAKMTSKTDNKPFVHETLIEEIDCAKDFAQDKYRDDGNCSIIKSEAGTYREDKSTAPASGFAYRLNKLNKKANPYWLEVEYPDDATRTFYVVVYQEHKRQVRATSLNTIGIITGDKHPITMTMQKKRLLFWPDSPNIMVGVYSYQRYDKQKGPALSKIRLYEISDKLPKLDVNIPLAYPQRNIGVWEEDPTMMAYAWFYENFQCDSIDLDFWHEKWKRVASYLNYSGQNMWDMLVYDYEGDTAIGDSRILPVSQYASGLGRIPGWADIGAVLFENEGINFHLSIHDVSGGGVARRGGLAKAVGEEHIQTDYAEAVAAGLDSSTCFNKKNLPAPFDGGSHSAGAEIGKLEPLHPAVQEAYLRIVRAYCEKFKKYKHFRGINFITAEWSCLYYHDLSEGYGDYPVSTFETETGIKVPVSMNDRERFSKRYTWLMENAKEKWIEWRTVKILDFYRKLRDIVCEDDNTRSLLISLRPNSYLQSSYEEWPEPKSIIYDYWRECGIDLKVFAEEKGITIHTAIEANYSRIALEKKDPPRYNWWHFNFSKELSPLWNTYENRSAMISYHDNLEALPFQDEKIPSYWWKFGLYREGLQTCFSTPHPNNVYALEHMTHFLAEFDPVNIVHGWWGCPDNGVLTEYQQFYRAFRSIPAVKFSDIPEVDDPVKARFYEGKNENFFYLVNRESYPVKISVSISGLSKGEIYNTVDGTIVALRETKDEGNGAFFDWLFGKNKSKYLLEVEMTAHQLLCYMGEDSMSIENISVNVPKPVVDALRNQLIELEKNIGILKKEGVNTEKAETVLQDARKLFQNKQYSATHYQLQSGPVIQINKNANDIPGVKAKQKDYDRFSSASEEFKQKVSSQKTYKSLALTEKMTIDGKLDEAIWQRAPTIKDFSLMNIITKNLDDKKELCLAPLEKEEETQLKICYDAEKIYAAFTCVGRPSYKSSPKNPVGQVYQRESVEILYSPNNNNEFYKIAVDVSGFMDAIHASVKDGVVNWSAFKWEKPSIEVATSIKQDKWTVEISVPFTSMGMTKAPKPGDTIKLNAVRNIFWRALPASAVLKASSEESVACVTSFDLLQFE